MTTLTSKSKVLFDSSFLYALADPSDKYRTAALKFALTNPDIVQIVPDVVLPEITHLLRRHIGHHAVIAFLKTFPVSAVRLEPITMLDIQRAYEIMVQYTDAHFDFVDCCIMALAERLTVTQICTFDRRDFSIFKPTHCDFLELMP